jgi:hypothetical protein
VHPVDRLGREELRHVAAFERPAAASSTPVWLYSSAWRPIVEVLRRNLRRRIAQREHHAGEDLYQRAALTRVWTQLAHVVELASKLP